jgi:hypothetical protein
LSFLVFQIDFHQLRYQIAAWMEIVLENEETQQLKIGMCIAGEW